MHILVVNDDGPPSTHASPYVHSLVRALQAAGHEVSVCLPHTQRSWIGKAHMIGQTVEPTYYRPPGPEQTAAGLAAAAGTADNSGTYHVRPWTNAAGESSPEEWVLVNGTPASCVQIGLHHVFRARGPVDLVVSGPNYGRNTTAVFALSSGTLGGALEAAACGVRAVAVSFAFFRRTTDHDAGVVAEASGHAVRVIEALARQWPADDSVDLYSVNVPLVSGVSTAKTLVAPILQNYWRGGACFVEVEAAATAEAAVVDGAAAQAEEALREGDGGEATGGKTTPTTTTTTTTTSATLTHQHFRWQPRFDDVFQSVEDAPAGNDGWVVREGMTSVSPLKANFAQAATALHGTELQLGAVSPSPAAVFALVAYGDPYVQPLVLAALRAAVPPSRLHLLPVPSDAVLDAPLSLAAALAAAGAPADAAVLQVAAYEAIDFEYAASAAAPCLVNSYVFRKALIRKHFLAATVAHWVAKRPASVLSNHVQRTEAFEVDYAEFLDDALVEAFDLRASLEANEALPPAARTWWILKPSMSDRGQGIRLFSTMEALQGIFDGWEGSDSEEEEENEDEDPNNADQHNTNITTSHLRHFVAQPYLHPPLLLPGCGGRKFHVRVYVLCLGALQVYVCRDMLALFAGAAYRAPWEAEDGEAEDGEDDNDEARLARHLTNTCLQDAPDKGDAVRRFWDLAAAGPGAAATCDALFAQICAITGELFEAAAVGMPIHFQPLPHAFEAYGLDFLAAADGTAYLLEVNAFPDFRQTGVGLQGVVAGFWADALRLAADRLGGGTGDVNRGQLVLVRDVALGRR